MSENRNLCYWILGIFSIAFLLVGGVMAHDRGIDQAIIDHLFDFHFDAQEALECDRDRWEADKIIEAEKQRRHNEFCDELESWWKDSGSSSGGGNEGTYSPPDNNGCRD